MLSNTKTQSQPTKKTKTPTSSNKKKHIQRNLKPVILGKYHLYVFGNFCTTDEKQESLSTAKAVEINIYIYSHKNQALSW